jgi:hypothetical protein
MIKYGDTDYGLEKEVGSFTAIRGADGNTGYVHGGRRSFVRALITLFSQTSFTHYGGGAGWAV